MGCFPFDRDHRLHLKIDKELRRRTVNLPSNRQEPLRAGSTASAQNAGGRMI